MSAKLGNLETVIIDQPGKISSFVGSMVSSQIQKWCHENPNILEGFEEWEKEYMNHKGTADHQLRCGAEKKGGDANAE